MVFVCFTCRLLERKEKHMTEFYMNTILLYKIIIGATIKGQRSISHAHLGVNMIWSETAGLSLWERYSAMSQAETQASRTRELRDMAGESDKKPGCCTRCPCLCGGVLLVTALVSLAGAAVIGGFYLQLHNLVDHVIEEVRSETVRADPVN